MSDDRSQTYGIRTGVALEALPGQEYPAILWSLTFQGQGQPPLISKLELTRKELHIMRDAIQWALG